MKEDLRSRVDAGYVNARFSKRDLIRRDQKKLFLNLIAVVRTC